MEQDLALCSACLAELPILGETCICCANPLESHFTVLEGYLTESALLQTRHCGQCLQNPPYFDHSMAFFPYTSPFDYLVHAVKFSGKLATTQLLGGLMARQISQTIDGLNDVPELLVAVPLHPSRLRERGYNQSFELARPISKRLHIPLITDLVQRIKSTSPQTSLSLRQRKTNLRDAFAISYSVKGQHVAIIDDVMTTGSTVNSLAKTLKQAGARRVSVWCLCRAESPG